MDPLLDLLAQYGLDSFDPIKLGTLPAADLTALHLGVMGVLRDRSEAAKDDSPEALAALFNASEAANTLLDVMESSPQVVRAAASAVTARGASRPAATKPRVPASPVSNIMTSSGERLTGADFENLMQQGLRDAGRGGTGRRLVASASSCVQLPHLGRDEAANAVTIDRAIGEQVQALRASGGICAPRPSLYEEPVIGSSARPVRDSLVRFDANRGGVRLSLPPTLDDVHTGVGVWDAATDATPGYNEKNIVRIDCPTFAEYVVEAVTARLSLGNFRARFWSEQVAAWRNQLMNQHARVAEQELLDAMVDDSTQAVTAPVLGSARDVLSHLDRAAVAMRSRQRLDPSYPLSMIAPSWLRSMMRTDLTRQMPGDDTLSVSDAQIDAAFAVRHVSVVWSIDWQISGFETQPDAGALLPWPTAEVSTLLFPVGTWLFLDGGILDLGIVRSPELNNTNDAELFVESFEACARRGTESMELRFETCPNGCTTAPDDQVDPCANGS